MKRKSQTLAHRLNISKALKGKKRKKSSIPKKIVKGLAGVGAVGAVGSLGYLGYKKLNRNYSTATPIDTKGKLLKPKALKPGRERRIKQSSSETTPSRTINVKGTSSIYQEQLPATTFPKNSKGKFKKKGKVKNGVMTGAETGFAPITVEAKRDFDGKYRTGPKPSRQKKWTKNTTKGLDLWMRKDS